MGQVQGIYPQHDDETDTLVIALAKRTVAALREAGHDVVLKQDGWRKDLYIDGLKIGLTFRQSLTREQVRYQHLRDKNVIVRASWGVEREDWAHYRTAIEKFDIEHLIKRLEAFVDEKKMEATEETARESRNAEQDAHIAKIEKQFGLIKGGRLKVFGQNYKDGGYEIMIRDLSQSELEPLVKLLHDNMDRI